MNEKQEYIRSVMLKAMAARLCANQKEFAEIVGVSRSGLSSAMNGDEKNLTDSLVRKVRAFAIEHGLESVTAPGVEPQKEAQSEDWKERLIESQQRTIESQQRTIEALTSMQTGIAVPGGVYAPKNFPADRK